MRRSTTVRRSLRRSKRSRNANVPEYASCSVSRTLQSASGDFLPSTFYNYTSINLADYPRAAAIAQGYQLFRIKQVKFTFKTYFDTYQAGGAGRPNLYWLINRGQNLAGASYTLENMKQMGCIPHVCDNKPFVVRFKPAVNESVLATSAPSALFSKVKLAPWLSTNQAAGGGTWSPNAIPHSGLAWFMEQAASGNTPTYGIDIEVQFQFLKPLVELTPQTAPPALVKLAEIDASPDGIQGGGDGLSVPIAH